MKKILLTLSLITILYQRSKAGEYTSKMDPATKQAHLEAGINEGKALGLYLVEKDNPNCIKTCTSHGGPRMERDTESSIQTSKLWDPARNEVYCYCKNKN